MDGTRRHLLALACGVVIAAAVPAVAIAVPPDPSVAAPRDSTRAVEYLWVTRASLLHPRDVQAVVDLARGMHVKGMLVQVVGRGDAYYTSDILPRAEALADDGFDPLGALVPLAHAAGIEVHAWMNCMLVWSAPQPPRSPKHVVRAHPEWVARLKSGRWMTSLTPRQRKVMGIEGVFLSPGHPGVRRWLASVAGEIATRYPVDGIHLDYIRQPSVEIGFDMETRARFAMETGVDPDRIPILPPAERARADSLWDDFQGRQVTAAVRTVRDTLSRVRPGLPLSAAVLADTITATSRNRQWWGAWLREGLLDRAYVMCYAPEIQTVMNQLVMYAARIGVDDRVVPGIGMYNTAPSAAAAKIKGARALGYPVLALYSYDALKEKPAYWPALLGLLHTDAVLH